MATTTPPIRPPKPKEPPASGIKLGTLVVVVYRAKNLPNKQRIGKQDPYCTVSVGHQKLKTEAIKRGGQTPRWDKQLEFEIWQSQGNEISVGMSESGGIAPSSSSALSTTTSSASTSTSIASSSATSSLSSVIGTSAGIGIGGRTLPMDGNRLSRPNGLIDDDLPGQATIGRTLSSNKGSSSVPTNDTTHPSSSSSSFTTTPIVTKWHIKCACYADDPKEPELIGEGILDFSTIFKKGELDEWVELKSRGKYAGEVFLEMTYYASGPPPIRRPPRRLFDDPGYGGPGQHEPLPSHFSNLSSSSSQQQQLSSSPHPLTSSPSPSLNINNTNNNNSGNIPNRIIAGRISPLNPSSSHHLRQSASQNFISGINTTTTNTTSSSSLSGVGEFGSLRPSSTNSFTNPSIHSRLTSPSLSPSYSQSQSSIRFSSPSSQHQLQQQQQQQSSLISNNGTVVEDTYNPPYAPTRLMTQDITTTPSPFPHNTSLRDRNHRASMSSFQPSSSSSSSSLSSGTPILDINSLLTRPMSSLSIMNNNSNKPLPLPISSSDRQHDQYYQRPNSSQSFQAGNYDYNGNDHHSSSLSIQPFQEPQRLSSTIPNLNPEVSFRSPSTYQSYDPYATTQPFQHSQQQQHYHASEQQHHLPHDPQHLHQHDPHYQHQHPNASHRHSLASYTPTTSESAYTGWNGDDFNTPPHSSLTIPSSQPSHLDSMRMGRTIPSWQDPRNDTASTAVSMSTTPLPHSHPSHPSDPTHSHYPHHDDHHYQQEHQYPHHHHQYQHQSISPLSEEGGRPSSSLHHHPSSLQPGLSPRLLHEHEQEQTHGHGYGYGHEREYGYGYEHEQGYGHGHSHEQDQTLPYSQQLQEHLHEQDQTLPYSQQLQQQQQPSQPVQLQQSDYRTVSPYRPLPQPTVIDHDYVSDGPSDPSQGDYSIGYYPSQQTFHPRQGQGQGRPPRFGLPPHLPYDAPYIPPSDRQQ